MAQLNEYYSIPMSFKINLDILDHQQSSTKKIFSDSSSPVQFEKILPYLHRRKISFIQLNAIWPYQPFDKHQSRFRSKIVSDLYYYFQKDIQPTLLILALLLPAWQRIKSKKKKILSFNELLTQTSHSMSIQ